MTIQTITRPAGTVKAVQWVVTNEAEMKEFLALLPAYEDSVKKSFVENDKFCLYLNQNKIPIYEEDWLILDAGRMYVLNKSQYQQVFVDIPAITEMQLQDAKARERPIPDDIDASKVTANVADPVKAHLSAP